MTKTAIKTFPGGETVATMVPYSEPCAICQGHGYLGNELFCTFCQGMGQIRSNSFFRVTVLHQFDSGNFVSEKPHEMVSEVAALGLLEFYTR